MNEKHDRLKKDEDQLYNDNHKEGSQLHQLIAEPVV